jgi:diaminopimelate epimerase
MNRERTIQVVKANCFGNSFVMVDEREGNWLEEDSYRRFAGQAIDVNFGVGADNLLVIQRNNEKVWDRIRAGNPKFGEAPDCDSEYLFRMFEPDGEEALCCGNGLLSIAHYLSDEYGVESASIATEIPLGRPNLIKIGSSPDTGQAWVNLGEPRRVPADIVGDGLGETYIGDIHVIDDLIVKFREHDLKPYTGSIQLKLKGYLIFTGEPHLVVVPQDGGISVPELTDPIFADSESNRGAGPMFKQRIRFGTWLVDRIGHFINVNFRHLFPSGINVNFANLLEQQGTVEYRCFERGINRETLACGTGAMAVAYVARHLYGLTGGVVRALPQRCRWYKRDARIEVAVRDDGWYLYGLPSIAFRGECELAG